MRSASDEALGLKSDDLEDDVDSLRSPFYKPRTSLRGYPLESPQSPPSEDSSYQGSIPGSGPSDRSYNGGGGGSVGSAPSGRPGVGGGAGPGSGVVPPSGGPGGAPSGGGGLSTDDDLEAIAAGYYLPDFKRWIFFRLKLPVCATVKKNSSEFQDNSNEKICEIQALKKIKQFSMNDLVFVIVTYNQKTEKDKQF